MRGSDFLLVIVSVALSSLSQVLLKMGTTQPDVRRAFQDAGVVDAAIAASMSPAIIAGFFCFGVSAIFWLVVLSRLSLSTAYPCVALGIVVTTVAGRLIFGEPISVLKLVAIAVIILGILILAASS
jgi:multidrug transporter EmrE-like cation transporter